MPDHETIRLAEDPIRPATDDRAPEQRPANLVEQPLSDDSFARKLLALAAEAVPDSIIAAAVIDTTNDAAPTPIAITPRHAPNAKDDPSEPATPPWLAAITPLITRAAKTNATLETDITARSADGASQLLTALAIPLPCRSSASALVAAFAIDARSSDLPHLRARLAGFAPLYAAQCATRRAEAARVEVGRISDALAAAEAFNNHAKLLPATRSLTDAIARRFNADRVAIAVRHADTVHAIALSHTEHFSRKQGAIRELEAAMEECFDQQDIVRVPAPHDQPTVSRETEALAAARNAVISMPLLRADECVGVITAERAALRPFTDEERDTLALTASLIGPRLLELRENDRGIGAKAAHATRNAAAGVLGPRHVGPKLAALALAAALAASFLIQTDTTATGPFTVRPSANRAVAAPFASTIESVTAKPQARLDEGEIIATLDTRDLRLQLSAANARLATAATNANAARAEGDQSAARIAAAAAAEARAEIALLRNRIDAATLRAPIAGTLLTDEPTNLLGSPVGEGQVLFRVAPLDRLHAEVSVPESRIADLRIGQRVTLAPASDPANTIRATVADIAPAAASLADATPDPSLNRQRDAPGNAFRVRVEFSAERTAGLRPGAEGIAEITTGRASLFNEHTRDLANWARLQMFKIF